MDRAVVLIAAWRAERIAERLPLVEEAAVLHAVLKGDAVWHVVLVRPGYRRTGTYLNIRQLVRKILQVHMGHAGDWRSLLGRSLLVSAHHATMAVLAAHHPITIAIPHKPAMCQCHCTYRASNSHQC